MDEGFNNNADNNMNNLDNTDKNMQDKNTVSSQEGNFNASGKGLDVGKKEGRFINNLFMDKSGHISGNKTGIASMAKSTRTFIILGWICAALTAFVSPLFAIGGIVFGVLANRQAAGSGNVLMITNIVLAAINIIFGLFLIAIIRRAALGY